MTYTAGNFEVPQFWTEGGSVYAADAYTCPYNTSGIERDYPECEGTDTVSEYTANVDDTTYENCEIGWIKDGLCMLSHIDTSTSNIRCLCYVSTLR